MSHPEDDMIQNASGIWIPRDPGRYRWRSDSESASPQPEYGVLTARNEVPPWSRGDVRLAALDPDPYSRGLADMKEHELVSMLLNVGEVFGHFFDPLFGKSEFWAAVEIQPRDLPGVLWQGKPGDIDLLLGRSVGGCPDFSYIIGVELKVRRPKRLHLGHVSGYGTEQAKGLRAIGCNAAVIAHVIVPHQSIESTAPREGFGSLYGMDWGPSATATLRHTVAALQGSRIGYLLGAWGHPAQNSALDRGAFWRYPILRPGPNEQSLWLKWQVANAKLRRGLTERWNELQPPSGVIRHCPRCHRVVPVPRRAPVCGACNGRWVPQVSVPLAMNVRPSDPSLP